MSTDAPIPQAAKLGHGRGPDALQARVAPVREADGAGAAAIGFRALLERLEQDARGLEQRAPQVNDAQELDGALRDARASLDRALEVGQGLVEALHAQRLSRAPEARP